MRAGGLPAESPPKSSPKLVQNPVAPASAPGQDLAAFKPFSAGGYLIRESESPEVFEHFRRLKRPVLQTAFGPLAGAQSQLLTITSPLAGAGKTFVSINLAHTLALEKDRAVLLIDTDSTQRCLTRQLGLSDRAGFFELINDAHSRLDDVVCRTDVPGLSVVPAGAMLADSLERLNSSRCKAVFRQILADNPARIVIMDGPPLLVTSEGPAIASYAGQILLVIEAGNTATSSFRASLELLDRQKPIGLILNKATGTLGFGFYDPE
jgi:Mrp family chromosome partitioning ATPase